MLSRLGEGAEQNPLQDSWAVPGEAWRSGIHGAWSGEVWPGLPKTSSGERQLRIWQK